MNTGSPRGKNSSNSRAFIIASTLVLSGSKVTKTYWLFTSPFTSYTPSIFSRIARILASLASQVHAGTYNLTTRAVSGTTLVVICCVVAHESRNRVKRKMAGNIFFLFMISSFLRTKYTYTHPSTLLGKQPIPLLQQKRDILFEWKPKRKEWFRNMPPL